MDRFRSILFENGQLESYWFFAEVPGDILMLAGRAGEAVEVLAEALDKLEQMGDPDPSITVLLGQALYLAGRFEEAGGEGRAGHRRGHSAARTEPRARALGQGPRATGARR